MSDEGALLQVNGKHGGGIERRAAVRFPCDFRTACHPVPEGEQLCTAKVEDISTSGIGLLVDSYIEPETLLALDLQHEETAQSYSLLIEVRHAKALPQGGWFLGCAFARDLTPAEVKALL